MGILNVKPPLAFSERKNKKFKEKKLVETLIELLLENGGIAFNGYDHTQFIEGGKELYILKEFLNKNDHLRKRVIDGLADGNIGFPEFYNADGLQILGVKEFSKFDRFVNKPYLKEINQYKGKNVAVLVGSNHRISFIEMTNKSQVEEDIKRIVYHDEVSKILENFEADNKSLPSLGRKHSKSSCSDKSGLLIKEELKKFGIPKNIEEILDTCMMDEDGSYCAVKRSERFKINDALMFIKTVLSNLDFYDIRDDEIKKQIRHGICNSKPDDFYLEEIKFSAKRRRNNLPFSDNNFRFFIF